jgi:hypothetical protein
MNTNKKKKSGSLAPVIILALIAVVAGSNFVGPQTGWFDRLANSGNKYESKNVELPEVEKVAGTPEETTTKTEVPTEASMKPARKPEPTSKPEAEPVKELSEFEKKHQEFIQEYLSKSAKPEIGKRYPVETLTNAVRDGVLEKIDEHKIYLVDIKPYNAKSNIHYSQLPPKMANFFFPERAANSYANKKLEEYLKAQNTIEEVVEVAATPGNPVAKMSSSFSAFDITLAKSPSRLAHAVLEVNEYLNNQNRRTAKMDGFDFVDVPKCHAKQQGRAAVFYMYVPKAFAGANNEYKYQVIDGVRRFWALRCMSNAVAVDSNAYLCVVYGDKIIGGSKLTSAEDTWVK